MYEDLFIICYLNFHDNFRILKIKKMNEKKQ